MASIFDIFSDQPSKDAAAAQIAGLTAGNNQATNFLNTGYTGARSDLGTNYGNAWNTLLSNFRDASNQISGNYGQASGALQSNYASALAPYLQNYKQAQGGVNQLEDVLGFGPGGSAGALQTLRATPGYQFALTSGDDAVNAAAAANGTLNSGNQLTALSKFNQGLADQTYNNYVSQLEPFLGASNAAAGGIAQGYQGLGQGQANIFTGLGDKLGGLSTALGGAQAGLSTNLGNEFAGLDVGQGKDLSNLAWQTQTGIGNANANADLSAYNASKNIWGALGAISPLAASVAGSFGGGGGAGPTGFGGGSWSLGGAPISSTMGSALFSMFSDIDLKEDVQPVGKLYDGQNVYSYRYKGDHVPRIGLIAQEVEQKYPEAVTEIAGFKAVDYRKATDYAAGLSRFLVEAA